MRGSENKMVSSMSVKDGRIFRFRVTSGFRVSGHNALSWFRQYPVSISFYGAKDLLSAAAERSLIIMFQQTAWANKALNPFATLTWTSLTLGQLAQRWA